MDIIEPEKHVSSILVAQLNFLWGNLRNQRSSWKGRIYGTAIKTTLAKTLGNEIYILKMRYRRFTKARHLFEKGKVPVDLGLDGSERSRTWQKLGTVFN